MVARCRLSLLPAMTVPGALLPPSSPRIYIDVAPLLAARARFSGFRRARRTVPFYRAAGKHWRAAATFLWRRRYVASVCDARDACRTTLPIFNARRCKHARRHYRAFTAFSPYLLPDMVRTGTAADRKKTGHGWPGGLV